MKTFTAAIIFLGMFDVSHAQNLIGKWQEQTPKVSSGNLNTYEFSDDSTFLFNTNEYFGLKRIVSIGGRYKFIKRSNTLILTVEFENETIGGTIERSNVSGEATDSWVITGGETKKIKLPKPVTGTIQVEFKRSDKGDAEFILLDKRKYFKVD